MTKQPIRAEMSGTIFRIETTAGAAVAEGDTLMILECMKMEIPVLAEKPGTITEIRVALGELVKEGDHLMTIAVG